VSAARAIRRRHVGSLIGAVVVAALIAASLHASDVPDATAADAFLPAEAVGSADRLVSNRADDLPWGVVGFGNWVHVSTNLRVPVFAVTQVGDRLFVGGMFARAQRGPGGRQVEQPFLAAFDIATGELIEDWRPRLDASVYALAATSDGKLIVGGEFTSVDGRPGTAALAALDPRTGAVIETWRSHLERPWSDQAPVVRALEVHGGRVYAAGNFSHHTSLSSRTRVHKVIRVAETNGDLDTAWLPEVTGAGLWAIAVAPDGSRITVGGYHSAVNGQAGTRWVGVVDGITGASVPGLVYRPTHSSSAHVQAIADTGTSLYYSGSQHYIFEHSTATWQRREGTTYTPGGDGQAIEVADGFVYNACHCLVGTAWTDSYSWPSASPGATAHRVNGISVHRENGFVYHDGFYPEIYYENGDGPWDLHMDTRGCLWVGGDVFRLDAKEPYRWARGFTRLCRDDADPPTTPTSLRATPTGTESIDVTLEWAPSTDDRGVTSYEIHRNGELVATVAGTIWTDRGIQAATTYRVRAVDARGNRSATSEPATAAPVVDDSILVRAGATWRHLDDGSNLPATWTTVGFDDREWRSGPAQLGFGDGDESTLVTPGRVQYWFRHTFEVTDPSASSLELELLADDGAVVYLNGVEVLRDTMPTGTLGFPAWSTLSKGPDAENAFTLHRIPADALVAGTNVVAVSVHNATARNGDLGFDLRLRRSVAAAPTQPAEVIAAGSSWRHLGNGTAPGPGWRTRAFDDSAWASGPAKLGYGDGDEATVLDAGRPRFITHYFRRSFDLPNPGAYTTLSIGLRRDDGAVVYLNGTELLRDRMPAGPVGPTTLAASFADGRDEIVFHPFTVPAAALVAGTNTVAVEVHSADQGSRDLGFDLWMVAQP
jgi:trimeric autotransporter adhesin